MTEIEFNNYLEKCKTELDKKQNQLSKEFKIGTFGNWKYDQETEKLYFINKGNIVLECEVIIISSWIESKNDWLWAWANKSLDINIIKKSEKLKELGIRTEYLVLNSEHLEADKDTTVDLASMAIEQLNALGLYVGPAGNSKIFFAIMAIKRR